MKWMRGCESVAPTGPAESRWQVTGAKDVFNKQLARSGASEMSLVPSRGEGSGLGDRERSGQEALASEIWLKNCKNYNFMEILLTFQQDCNAVAHVLYIITNRNLLVISCVVA